MKNKKGFTLVEMLLTGTILVVIAVITVPNIISSYNNTKENEYQRFLSDIFLATEVYVQKHSDEYNELKNTNGQAYIYINQLLNSRYLKSTLYDPKNKKQIKEESDFTVEVIKKDDGTYAYKLYEERLVPEYCEFENGYVWNFDYTGSEQTFTVPCSGKYKIETWGAQGGQNGYLGGYSSGEISLMINTDLYIYVGQNGQYNNYAWNGGGFSPNVTNSGKYGGGGATDIRYFNSENPSETDLLWNSSLGLNSRIMVAGAGGAATTYHLSTPTLFGVGGGLVGGHINDGYDSSGYGGMQTSGGRGGSILNGNYLGTGGSGSFGIGGNGTSHAWAGGAGYYGGGGGSRNTATDGGGGGGSSYISGHAGCVAISSSTSTTPKNGCSDGTTDIECSKHYSGYIFNNTIMIDGDGYNWTTEKGSYTGMPTHDGASTMKGNTGNGYAKITYLGK